MVTISSQSFRLVLQLYNTPAVIQDCISFGLSLIAMFLLPNHYINVCRLCRCYCNSDVKSSLIREPKYVDMSIEVIDLNCIQVGIIALRAVLLSLWPDSSFPRWFLVPYFLVAISNLLMISEKLSLKLTI